ncbi:MAG: hypothetical protein ACYCXR_07145 [Coriobacteriia bacterium]
MDCLQAAEILSAALDGAPVSPGSVAHAREHAARCPECAALLATMGRISTASRVRAPEPMIARILDAARSEADARADADAVAAQTAPTSGVILPLEPVRPRPRVAPRWWQPHFTPLASAAAVVLVVSAASTYVLVQMTGPSAEVMTTDSIEIALTDEYSGTESAPEELAASPENDAASNLAASARSAPSYLAWDGSAWVRTDGPTPGESSLTNAGATETDLGEPDGVKSHEVLTSVTEPDAIFVRAADGSLIRFSQVTRTLGGRTYALTAGPIVAPGTWPALPSRYPTPAADDGSPGFTPGGIDDRGREVFVPVGSDVSGGFALAPGTPPDDPAAGNPNWTWWEPVD